MIFLCASIATYLKMAEIILLPAHVLTFASFAFAQVFYTRTSDKLHVTAECESSEKENEYIE